MKLYKHLQLQRDQRTALAERWHSWCWRRRHLDGALNSAVVQLQNLVERSRKIPLAAFTLATQACAITGPTDKGAGVIHEPEADGNIDDTSPRLHVHNDVAQANGDGVRGHADPQPAESVTSNDFSFRFPVSVVAVTKFLTAATLADSGACSPAFSQWNQDLNSDEATSTLQSATMLAATSEDEVLSPVYVRHHASHPDTESRGSAAAFPQVFRTGLQKGTESAQRSAGLSAMSCSACSPGPQQGSGVAEQGGWDEWQPHAWVPCKGCEGVALVEAKLLGDTGEMMQAAQEALKSIISVSKSDELMHCEFLGLFWEFSEVCSRYRIGLNNLSYLTCAIVSLL